MAGHRPEVADVFREHGGEFLRDYADHTTKEQKRVLRDITVCRTAVLGGHKRQCDICGHEEVSYNSCRTRHCPKCQARARARWYDEQKAALLRVDVENELVLHSVANIEAIKSQLASKLGVEFDATDSSGHGYPIERAALGTSNNPQWLWLSPNLVPRGFVREDDPRYEELKGLMAGDALRYPQIAADSYLLSATDGVRDRVLEACADAQLVLRPLEEYI